MDITAPSPPPVPYYHPNPISSWSSSQTERSDSSPSSSASSQGSKDFISRLGTPDSDYSQTSYGSDQDSKLSARTSAIELSPGHSADITPLPKSQSQTHPQLQKCRTFQPPTLTRSADVKEQFVKNLVGMSTNQSLTLNSKILGSAKVLVEVIWPLAASSRHSLSLKTYIEEILKRTKTSFSTLQVALYYLVLIKNSVPQFDFTMEHDQDISSLKGMMCGRRMFLTAIILSSKYLQDKNFSSKAWSKITSLSVKEINANELYFLREVNWNLHVPEAKFNKWQSILIEYSKPVFIEQWKHAIRTLTPDLNNLPPIPTALPSNMPSLQDLLSHSPQSPKRTLSLSTRSSGVLIEKPSPSKHTDASTKTNYFPPSPPSSETLSEQQAAKGLNAMLSAWNICKSAASARCLLDNKCSTSGSLQQTTSWVDFSGAVASRSSAIPRNRTAFSRCSTLVNSTTNISLSSTVSSTPTLVSEANPSNTNAFNPIITSHLTTSPEAFYPPSTSTFTTTMQNSQSNMAFPRTLPTPSPSPLSSKKRALPHSFASFPSHKFSLSCSSNISLPTPVEISLAEDSPAACSVRGMLLHSPQLYQHSDVNSRTFSISGNGMYEPRHGNVTQVKSNMKDVRGNGLRRSISVFDSTSAANGNFWCRDEAFVKRARLGYQDEARGEERFNKFME